MEEASRDWLTLGRKKIVHKFHDESGIIVQECEDVFSFDIVKSRGTVACKSKLSRFSAVELAHSPEKVSSL